MDLEIVTVGTELVLGLTLDSNGAEAARALAAVGVRVTRRVSVADRADAIRDAVREALARTGAVLTTGGLGPTRDDMTKRAVAELFGAPLEFQPALWDALAARFAALGRVPAAANRSQAEIPRGATVLANRWGTAPGLWLEGPPGLAILLPGVPHEMRNLLQEEVVPRLAARAGGGRAIRSLVVRTTGIPESTLAERLAPVEDRLEPLTLAYLPGYAGVDLRLTAWDLPAEEADGRLREAADLLRARVPEHVYGEGDTDLAAVVLGLARERRLTLGVAESCTGGLLGGRLTDVPGSSDVFAGGVVCYADALKVSLLDVPADLIRRHGAVSEAVVRAMAEGALRRLGVAAAIAVTGIAGPSGGTPEKPVGTVWLAAALDGETTARRSVLPGGRAEVRARAAQAALFLLYRRLQPAAKLPT